MNKKYTVHFECSNFHCKYSSDGCGTAINCENVQELVDTKPKCHLCGSDLVYSKLFNRGLSKVVTEFDMNKISDDVLKKKADDQNVTLDEFGKEVKKHESILKKITKAIKSFVFA